MELIDIINKKEKFILVGCETVKERDALSELWHVSVKYCNIIPIEPFELPIRGLVLLAISEDPYTIIKEIKKVVSDKLFEFQHCKTFTPIEKIIESSFEKLKTIIPDYLRKVPKEARWKITVNRRHTTLKRNEIIELIASLPEAPKGKIDLENPDWEIIIELFGKWIGIGVSKSDYKIKIKSEEV